MKFISDTQYKLMRKKRFSWVSGLLVISTSALIFTIKPILAQNIPAINEPKAALIIPSDDQARDAVSEINNDVGSSPNVPPLLVGSADQAPKAADALKPPAKDPVTNGLTTVDVSKKREYVASFKDIVEKCVTKLSKIPEDKSDCIVKFQGSVKALTGNVPGDFKSFYTALEGIGNEMCRANCVKEVKGYVEKLGETCAELYGSSGVNEKSTVEAFTKDSVKVMFDTICTAHENPSPELPKDGCHKDIIALFDGAQVLTKVPNLFPPHRQSLFEYGVFFDSLDVTKILQLKDTKLMCTPCILNSTEKLQSSFLKNIYETHLEARSSRAISISNSLKEISVYISTTCMGYKKSLIEAGVSKSAGDAGANDEQAAKIADLQVNPGIAAASLLSVDKAADQRGYLKLTPGILDGNQGAPERPEDAKSTPQSLSNIAEINKAGEAVDSGLASSVAQHQNLLLASLDKPEGGQARSVQNTVVQAAVLAASVAAGFLFL